MHSRNKDVILEAPMKQVILFHIHKGDAYYIAEGVDLPIVTQGKTLDELMANLKEAVELHLEDEPLADYNLTAQPSVLANFELPIKVPVYA